MKLFLNLLLDKKMFLEGEANMNKVASMSFTSYVLIINYSAKQIRFIRYKIGDENNL